VRRLLVLVVLLAGEAACGKTLSIGAVGTDVDAGVEGGTESSSVEAGGADATDAAGTTTSDAEADADADAADADDGGVACTIELCSITTCCCVRGLLAACLSLSDCAKPVDGTVGHCATP
jgi:hypothetical protein